MRAVFWGVDFISQKHRNRYKNHQSLPLTKALPYASVRKVQKCLKNRCLFAYRFRHFRSLIMKRQTFSPIIGISKQVNPKLLLCQESGQVKQTNSCQLTSLRSETRDLLYNFSKSSGERYPQ